MIKCYIDGACGPKNPGGAMGWGGVVLQDGIRIEEFSTFYPDADANSNNVAEYLALQEVLDRLGKMGLGDEKIEIYTDSMLIKKQIDGHWKIKRGLYKDNALDAKKMTKKFKNLRVFWLPREENGEADMLSKKGFVERGIKLKY